MKKLALLFVLFTGTFISQAQNGSTILIVEWQFINVIDGYDHQSKMKFFVDWDESGESGVSLQTSKSQHALIVPEGIHTISMQNWALYQGTWEEHTGANEYSLDAFYEIIMDFKPGVQRKVSILFDIDSEKVITVSVD